MKITIGILLFILSVSLIGQNLDKPFWGEHDVKVIDDQDKGKI